jgi:hypothetical protein
VCKSALAFITFFRLTNLFPVQYGNRLRDRDSLQIKVISVNEAVAEKNKAMFVLTYISQG